jgi:DNA-binding FadR family transcriptional regulator
LPPAITPSTTEPRQSRPAQVADAIKNWVVSEGLRPGDRLPAEPQMISQYGMSKGTIREAMRLLEAQGLIRTRTGPGGGSFVHEVSDQRAKSLLGNYFYFKDLTIGDIYQLRRVLEPELVAALAGKLSDDVLQDLEDIVATYAEPAATLDAEREQHVASLRFHALLAQQADNKLLGFVIDFMVSLLSDLTVHRKLYSPPNLELWSKGRDYQTRLLMALRAGDKGAARAIMKAHMSTAWKLMNDQEVVMLRRFMSE